MSLLERSRMFVHQKARVTKKWKGLGIEAFTTADNYMVEIDDSVSGPFRMLAVASAASIDTALKQDTGGFN